MKITITVSATIMALFSTAAAWKCDCNNLDRSYQACHNLNHVYSYYSCGTTGCYLTEGEIDDFIAHCDAYGEGFMGCIQCQTCW